MAEKFARNVARPARRWLIFLIAGSTLLTACGPPPEARIEPTERLERMPPPVLAPTAGFEALAQAAGPDAAAAREEADALRARAAALRERAAALSATEPAAQAE